MHFYHFLIISYSVRIFAYCIRLCHACLNYFLFYYLIKRKIILHNNNFLKTKSVKLLFYHIGIVLRLSLRVIL